MNGGFYCCSRTCILYDNGGLTSLFFAPSLFGRQSSNLRTTLGPAVLTTHFMDEADILCDRIAIMSRGRLKTCGSSLFLKNRFGLGYHLTIEKSDEKSGVADANTEAPLTALVTVAVRGARLLSNAARELSYMLPLAEVAAFAPLLERLEGDEGKDLGVGSYGISLTTLEEVFLRIAAEESIDPEDVEQSTFMREVDSGAMPLRSRCGISLCYRDERCELFYPRTNTNTAFIRL